MENPRLHGKRRKEGGAEEDERKKQRTHNLLEDLAEQSGEKASAKDGVVVVGLLPSKIGAHLPRYVSTVYSPTQSRVLSKKKMVWDRHLDETAEGLWSLFFLTEGRGSVSITHEVRPTVVLVLMVPYIVSITRTGTCSSAGPRVGRHEGPGVVGKCSM